MAGSQLTEEERQALRQVRDNPKSSNRAKLGACWLLLEDRGLIKPETVGDFLDSVARGIAIMRESEEADA